MKSIFDGYDRISEKNLNEMREYNRQSGIPPYLTVQEVEVCRYAAREKERKGDNGLPRDKRENGG
jgi:hypothetical protein